jgi:hypothetical protein
MGQRDQGGGYQAAVIRQAPHPASSCLFSRQDGNSGSPASIDIHQNDFATATYMEVSSTLGAQQEVPCHVSSFDL